MIGIVGGIGPEAGNHLHSLIIKNTIADSDAEHFNVILYSANYIPDRSLFLEGNSQINPGYVIVSIIDKIVKLGAKVIVIACNQVYSSSIFKIIDDHFSKSNIKIVNVVTETFKCIGNEIKKIGILSRTGLFKTKMFEEKVKNSNYEFVYPDIKAQNTLDKTIGDKKYGIKGGYHLISNKPKEIVEQSIINLINSGAEVVVLACTELALVIDKTMYKKYNLLDTNEILARASIKYLDKNKIK